MKSTSRPKLADLDKNHLHLHQRGSTAPSNCGSSTAAAAASLSSTSTNNSRKSSAPPDLDTAQIAKAAAKTAAARKHMRSHSNLNFNALLRYKLTNRVLATVDFGDSVRRKSEGISSGGGGGSSNSESGFLAGLVRSGKEVARRSRRNTASRETTPVSDRESKRSAAADTINVDKDVDNDHESSDSNDDDDEKEDDDKTDDYTDNDDENSDDDDDDDDCPVSRSKKRDYIKEKEAAAEAARVYKKSPSLSARVAAHFTSTDGGKNKLSKLKKQQRRNSRISGLYTQNSFGKSWFGLVSLDLFCSIW